MYQRKMLGWINLHWEKYWDFKKLFSLIRKMYSKISFEMNENIKLNLNKEIFIGSDCFNKIKNSKYKIQELYNNCDCLCDEIDVNWYIGDSCIICNGEHDCPVNLHYVKIINS